MYPETAAEALEKWDAGESVWTVEMGGLGPGYEQCIHIMCFEIIRRVKDEELPWDDHAAIENRFDAALHDWPGLKQMGPSGAQVGAAQSMAAMYLRHGWRRGIEMAKEQGRGDDLIQVSRDWPQP